MFECKSQLLFYKMLFSYSLSKNYFQALFLFLLCKQTLTMIIKIYSNFAFILKTYFILVWSIVWNI
jgi:hypothetical protein